MAKNEITITIKREAAKYILDCCMAKLIELWRCEKISPLSGEDRTQKYIYQHIYDAVASEFYKKK